MFKRPERRDVYGEDFDVLCRDLADDTRAFDADLVVGVETGGARVAEAMLPHLGNPAYATVRWQRPATKAKDRLGMGAVTSRLPRPLADALRWLEVEGRELALGRRPLVVQPGAESLLASSDLHARAATSRRILVVDDTVDSGLTLSVVTRAVEMAQPAAEVRTAVLASTWRRPPVRPDHCLLDRTLLRLPWSFDAA
ncbi:phosphoribosyltransferase family protein [Modestobacter sp. VKM Ac-2983]|uniref:phosphoribosyltransferase family protein n=1 Tax=Modestobacter sp. VKM Ac-2983 TaxID=3004137 RepID=UPI0022AB5F60|nr:phosphoribosyltransferase family protein [Modestobacter sp. VKM Ac-2983]MCZ2803678.1 phosphoribosyltransferase family protein [Modestobacter sp. VKM Ac-2983]